MRLINPIQELQGIKAQLSMTERLLLYTLVISYQPSRMLEIGTGGGGSAQIVTLAMDAVNRGSLISLDVRPERLLIDSSTIIHRARLITGQSPGIIPEIHSLIGGDFDFW